MSWFYRKEIKWNVYWKLQATWNYYRKGSRLKEEVKCLQCWYVHYVDRCALFTLNCWCRMCWHTKHWLADTRFYQVWKNINQRCKSKHFKDYHWKWIKVERKTFEEFKNDMYESYEEHIKEYWEKDTSIDRIDYNGNYCKDNCRWATNIEQANNTRKNVGVYKLAREEWIPRNKVVYRYYTKWLSLEGIKQKFK